jgi:hypothetical protein
MPYMTSFEKYEFGNVDNVNALKALESANRDPAIDVERLEVFGGVSVHVCILFTCPASPRK